MIANISEAKTHLSKLANMTHHGEEVVIAKDIMHEEFEINEMCNRHSSAIFGISVKKDAASSKQSLQQ